MLPKMNDSKLHPVTTYRSILGEGPVWDSATKSILWLDIVQGIIHEYFPAKEKHSQLSLGEMVGAIALSQDNQLIAALQSGFAFIERKNGMIRRIQDPEAHLPENRFNDGKCDPAGRFWAGTMALDEAADAGNLYMLDQHLLVTIKISNVSVSNGMAWRADESTFYYIDSPTRQVVAYDFERTSGTLSNRRVVITIPEGEGFPDGMTIDTEDKLWIAHWDGWQVSRWDPDTGEKLLQIDLPVAKVTSCVFGGPTLQDLYITTASIGLDDMDLQKQPLAGQLFVWKRTGYQGQEADRFHITTG